MVVMLPLLLMMTIAKISVAVGDCVALVAVGSFCSVLFVCHRAVVVEVEVAASPTDSARSLSVDDRLDIYHYTDICLHAHGERVLLKVVLRFYLSHLKCFPIFIAAIKFCLF